MAFCKIAPPTSGTGNATVRIISMKNNSTVPRSQSFTVVSGSGIRRTITVNQEGVKGKYLTLNFPSGTVSTSLSVGQTFFVSSNGPDLAYAEFYGELGTIKSVTSEQIVIDMSGLTQTDIDVIYDDLTVGDMMEMNEVFFGIASDNDPTVKWTPIVKTTETSGEAGNYNYTSNYVAETITQAYEGTVSGVLNCTAVAAASSLVITPKSPQIYLEDEVILTVTYTKIIPDSLKFNAGPGMGESVYQFDWNPPASTGGVDATGSFTFRIATNSEASEGTYTFTITAVNEMGKTITARGEVRVVS